MLPPVPRMSRAEQTARWIARPGPFLFRAHRAYGDVFTIHFGAEPPWVVLAHPDAVREVFTGDAAALHAGKANLVLLPFLLTVLGGVRSWPVLLGLLALPAAALRVRKVLGGADGRALIRVLGQTGLLLLAWSVLTGVGLALVAALLNAVFAFCLGCEVYLLVRRFIATV